ncbi:MAG: RNA polymerase sigma factor, partial [Gemmataceae bacterium]
ADRVFLGCLDRHRLIVLKVARAYARTAADCQDLVQDILLQLWQSVPRFGGRAGEATWVYRVALNTALGWHRKESRRRPRQFPLVDVEVPHHDPAQREAVEGLYAAIRRLPAPDVALILLYMDDLSYREMAEVLGTSEGNVGVRLTRTRKALAELLREDCHDP